MTSRPAVSALVIDAVEWFHDPALAGHLSRRHWRRLPVRAQQAIEAAAALCARHGVQATFCVSGAIAERLPELLRRLVQQGHEVACAGQEPVDLVAVPPAERLAVLAGWARARQAIEAATGQRVRGFRAAWPVPGGEAWWREALRAAGYDYDASSDASAWGTGVASPAGLRVHTFTGGSVLVQTFAAWQLDSAQPRLQGLPRGAHRAHYERLVDAEDHFATLLATRPWASIATVLQLPVTAVAVAMPAPQSVAAVPAAATAAPATGVPRMAIVVPMKDEAAGLPSLLAELDLLSAQLRAQMACEFVFVDDGSTDRTWPLLQELLAGRTNVRLVRHPHNLGVAAAIRSGIAATDAPVLASIDADLSYDPMELGRMLALLDGADLVTASPYHPQGSVRNVPGWRLLLSRTLSGCYRLLLRSPVRTWTSCFRVYRRAAIAELPLAHPGFLGTAELLVRVLRRGGTVREHPCELQARLFGQSKMRVLRTIGGHLRLLWQVSWRRIG